MHAKPKIFQVKLRHIVAIDRVRIKIELLQIAAKLATLLVLSPKKTDREQNERRNDRRNQIDGNIAPFDHVCWLPRTLQIAAEIAERDIFDENIRRLSQGERNCVCHLPRTYHFVAWPIAFHIVPDIGGGGGRINVDDANFAIAQLLAE